MNRAQRIAAVVGLAVVLALGAWVSTPFRAGAHSCRAAIWSRNYQGSRDRGLLEFGDFKWADQCRLEAERRLGQAGVVAALAVVGSGLSVVILRDPRRPSDT